MKNQASETFIKMIEAKTEQLKKEAGMNDQHILTTQTVVCLVAAMCKTFVEIDGKEMSPLEIVQLNLFVLASVKETLEYAKAHPSNEIVLS